MRRFVGVLAVLLMASSARAETPSPDAATALQHFQAMATLANDVQADLQRLIAENQRLRQENAALRQAAKPKESGQPADALKR